MKRILSLLLIMLSGSALLASEHFDVKLYSGKPAVDNGLYGAETCDSEGRIGNISDPRITVYLPAKENATCQAVVICPGGGYHIVSSISEGSQVAEWLAARGIAGIVLRYRMPNHHSEVPLSDALRAMEIVNENAREWGINPTQIGIMGFSAGGHLAATVCTKYTSERNRPAFGVLFYPVITLELPDTHEGTRYNLLEKNPSNAKVDEFCNEKHIDAATPPTFIALAADDTVVPPSNSTKYFDRLVECGVKVEMHVYPTGGHGWGFTEGRFEFLPEVESALASWLNRL